jgi:hypothetical protein
MRRTLGVSFLGGPLIGFVLGSNHPGQVELIVGREDRLAIFRSFDSLYRTEVRLVQHREGCAGREGEVRPAAEPQVLDQEGRGWKGRLF